MLTDAEQTMIDQAIKVRIDKFERQLKEIVAGWVSGIGLNQWDFVGTRVGGSEPRLLTREEKVAGIVSNITYYGEE